MKVNAIWIGDTIPELHAMCMRSWLRHGHKYVLWTYDPTIDVPSGVIRRNARQVFDSPILRYVCENGSHNDGSPVLHANMFRYKFLAEHGGTFIDSDTLCLSNEMPESYCFSSENAKHDIPNFAFVRLPPRTALMQACFVEAQHRLHEPTAGRFGPKLLSDMMRHVYGEPTLPNEFKVLPAAAFCKLRWHQTAQFFAEQAPDLTGCYGLHLWARQLQKEQAKVVAKHPPTSLWERFRREYT